MNDAESFKRLKELTANAVSRTVFACLDSPVDVENRWPPPPGLLVEHVEFMKNLKAEGKLFASGPFLNEAGDRTPSGMFVLEVADRDAAEALVAADPLVKENYRKVEIRPWQFNEPKED